MTRPLLLLDLDDVICINAPYGGYDVLAPDQPADLFERLFHAPAVAVLLEVLAEHQAQVVLTTSWLRLFDRERLVDVFSRTGLGALAAALHEQWSAETLRGEERLQAVDRWLSQHHRGEPYVLLDDSLSGTSLIGSEHDKQGRLVLCEVEVGLTPAHAERIRAILQRR